MYLMFIAGQIVVGILGYFVLSKIDYFYAYFIVLAPFVLVQLKTIHVLFKLNNQHFNVRKGIKEGKLIQEAVL